MVVIMDVGVVTYADYTSKNGECSDSGFCLYRSGDLDV